MATSELLQSAEDKDDYTLYDTALCDDFFEEDFADETGGRQPENILKVVVKLNLNSFAKVSRRFLYHKLWSTGYSHFERLGFRLHQTLQCSESEFRRGIGIVHIILLLVIFC